MYVSSGGNVCQIEGTATANTLSDLQEANVVRKNSSTDRIGKHG